MVVEIPYFIVAGVFTVITLVFIWRLLSALLVFRKDLATHQQDDCKRLDELVSHFIRLEQHVIDLKAATEFLTKSVSEKYDETIARVVEHRLRNEAHLRTLTTRLDELLSRVATLEGVSQERTRHETVLAATSGKI